MQNFLDSIKQSLKDKNRFAALFISLTIPDIAGKIEYPGLSSSKRYTERFNKFMDTKYMKHISGDDCYALRCSYLHEGSSNTDNQKIKDIVEKYTFIPDGSHLCSFRSSSGFGSTDDGKNICHISVTHFCNDIIVATNKRLQSIESDHTIKETLRNMLKINEKVKLFNGGVLIQ